MAGRSPMNKIFFLLMIFSTTVFAEIQPGVWKGVVSDQAYCFMDVGPTTFVNGFPHPLNERIEIKIGQTIYSVKHPHSVNAETGEISFNHDLFEDVVPTATGAFALQIQMDHSTGRERPQSLVVMEHDWKTGFKEVLNCHSLKWVSP